MGIPKAHSKEVNLWVINRMSLPSTEFGGWGGIQKSTMEVSVVKTIHYFFFFFLRAIPVACGSSHHSSVGMNLMRIHEDVGLIPGLPQWAKNLVFL